VRVEDARSLRLSSGDDRARAGRIVAATACTLLAAFALQLVAYRHGGHGALSDLPRVLLHRGIRPGSLPYVDRPIEYPVGAGALLYLAVLLAPSPFGVLAVTAMASAVICVAVAIHLGRRCGPRAWRWALAPPLILYAFQNWDVFAIGAMVGGLLAYERGHDRLAGSLIGVGAAVKLFPAVVLPPLIARRWARGDRRGAARVAAAAALSFAALNLPVLVASPHGWAWPFTFQSRRPATWGTAWLYLYQALGLPLRGASSAHLANVVSLLALGGGVAWLTVRTVRQQLDPAASAAAAVAIFILSNKVYSPTYDIWLVVFFALLPLSRGLWISFCGVDLAIFVTVYGYFRGFESRASLTAVLPLLVLVRTVVLFKFVADVTRHSKVRARAAPRAPLTSRSHGGLIGW